MKKRIAKTLAAILLVISLIPISPAAPLAVKAAEETILINDSETGTGMNQFNFAEEWGTSSGYPDRFEGGDEHWFNFAHYTAGNPLPSFSIRFKGTGIELYGDTQPGLGIYNIYIDNEKVGEVDAYSATRAGKVKLFEKTGLVYGEHAVKVELTNTKNNLSSAPDGQIDYAKVLGVRTDEDTEYISTIEDTQVTDSNELFKFKYTGTWYEEKGYPDQFSNGDDHYSNNGGDFYEITFIGNKIEIYGTKNPAHGIYDVYVDGVFKGRADATSTSGKIHKQLLFTADGLEEGQHVVKVALPEDSNKAIQADFVKVYHKAIQASEIILSDTSLRLETGMTKRVTAEVLPSIAVNKEVLWESSNDEAVTVSEDGTITAVSETEADAVVTATVAGTEVKAEVTVKVVPEVRYLSAFVGNADKLETQEDYMELTTGGEESFRGIAWKGDVLNSKITAVSRKNPVTNVEVTASDFTNGKAVIDASNVEINWLKEVKANIGRGNSSAPVKDFPDVIYHGGKIDMEAESVRFAWVKINVPRDAEAGKYQGTLTLDADGLENPYTFDYEFEVVNLIQPDAEEAGTQIQVWQHPFAVANYYGVAEEDYFTEAHFRYMRASMKEYRELGGKDVVANIVEEAWNHQSFYSDPSMVKWTKNTDGTFSFDYTWYDAWIEFQTECGVLDPANGVGQIKCYSIVPWNNQIAYYDAAAGRVVKQSFTPGSQEWKNIWTAFLDDFMTHSKEKGWFGITYISMDERGLEQLEPAVALLKSIKGADGIGFKISSAFNFDNTTGYDFTDKIDDISINLGNIAHANDVMKDLSTHRKELGLLTTIYTCTGNYPGNFVISDPADNNWVMWDTLRHNTDGFMRWAWDNWVENPLENTTYWYWEPGDGWFVYPVEKGDSSNPDYFYSTPRYEMMKQGVRDINKAKYLMQQSDELNKEITALTASLKQPNSTTSYGSAVAASEADRELVFAEVDRMRSGVLELSKEYAGTVEKEFVIRINGNPFVTGPYNQKVCIPESAVPEAPEGQVFAGWEADGKLVSQKEEFLFYIAGNVNLKARFTEDLSVLEEQADALMSNVLTTKRSDGKTDVQFVGQLVIPEGYKIVNTGLIWSTKEEKDVPLIVGDGLNQNLNPTYAKAISNTNQFSITIKGLPSGMFLRGRIFATIQNKETQETKFVYSVEKKAFAVK